MKTKNFIIYSTRVVLFSLLFAGFAFSAQSQVTIGSASTPLKNVLLDLKETDEASGNANSEKGLVLPRVFLTAIDSLSPILTSADPDYETLKPAYTGIIVYNVNATAPFEKGVYVWDGTQWNQRNASQLSNILATNGLSLNASTGAVELGGTLNTPTAVNLMNNNLIFNADNGKIGVETSAPQAALHIANPNGDETLILKNLRYVTDTNNPIETATTPTYHDLMISGDGVVRKAQSLSNGNQSIAYSLQSTNVLISQGDSVGNGGTELLWSRNGATSIVLPQAGTYVFAFCLYGTLTINTTPTIPSNLYVPSGMTPTDVNSYYISAFKNGTAAANLANIQEFVITYTVGYNYANYSVFLSVSGNAGDVIHFKLAADLTRSTRFTWNLTSTGNNAAQKTSLIFWKL